MCLPESTSSPSPLQNTLLGDAGEQIAAPLCAGTSSPAGLRHGTGRSLVGRNWINWGKLQQQPHQLSNGLASPCTGCSIFQPNSQEKAHEEIYHKTVFFAVQKKNIDHILVSCSQRLHTGAEPVSSYHPINHIPSCKICFQANRNTDNLPANDLNLHIFSSEKSYTISLSPHQHTFISKEAIHIPESQNNYNSSSNKLQQKVSPSSSIMREHKYPNILAAGII